MKAWGGDVLALVINLNVSAAYRRGRVPFSFEGQADWAPNPMWSLLDNNFFLEKSLTLRI
jgi:hypothetical protein